MFPILIKLGFDSYYYQSCPRNLARFDEKVSFYQYGNPFKSTELALFSSVPRYAIAYQIPLIWWGENSALQVGESSVMGKSGSDGNNLRKMNDAKVKIFWILENDFWRKEILQYSYPPDRDFEKSGIRIVFRLFYGKVVPHR